MKLDISDRADIEKLVNHFYTQIRTNAMLGPIFEKAIGDHWDSHLPKMYSFWSSILLKEDSYKGNPLKKHIELARKFKLEKIHFETWVELFQASVDELYQGPKAIEIKERASSIAQIMQSKICNPHAF